MEHILVDANNMLYRAIGRVNSFIKKNPDRQHDLVDGVDVGIINSFMDDLYKISENFLSPEVKIYLVWDRKLEPQVGNWRNEVIPAYKQNRDSNREMKQQVHKLCLEIKHLTDTITGIITVFPLHSECDDIINYLRNTLEGGSLIISSDHDFFQCVEYGKTCVFNPFKKVTISAGNFEEHIGIPLDKFVLFKSIKGDTSDNIKGLYRYGEVKAKKLALNWEEDSKKLSEEQLQVLNECIEVIDLNSRPLSMKEQRAVELQINSKRPDDMASRVRMMDHFHISPNVKTSWGNFVTSKELLDF